MGYGSLRCSIVAKLLHAIAKLQLAVVKLRLRGGVVRYF